MVQANDINASPFFSAELAESDFEYLTSIRENRMPGSSSPILIANALASTDKAVVQKRGKTWWGTTKRSQTEVSAAYVADLSDLEPDTEVADTARKIKQFGHPIINVQHIAKLNSRYEEGLSTLREELKQAESIRAELKLSNSTLSQELTMLRAELQHTVDNNAAAGIQIADELAHYATIVNRSKVKFSDTECQDFNVFLEDHKRVVTREIIRRIALEEEIKSLKSLSVSTDLSEKERLLYESQLADTESKLSNAIDLVTSLRASLGKKTEEFTGVQVENVVLRKRVDEFKRIICELTNAVERQLIADTRNDNVAQTLSHVLEENLAYQATIDALAKDKAKLLLEHHISSSTNDADHILNELTGNVTNNTKSARKRDEKGTTMTMQTHDEQRRMDTYNSVSSNTSSSESNSRHNITESHTIPADMECHRKSDSSKQNPRQRQKHAQKQKPPTKRYASEYEHQRPEPIPCCREKQKNSHKTTAIGKTAPVIQQEHTVCDHVNGNLKSRQRANGHNDYRYAESSRPRVIYKHPGNNDEAGDSEVRTVRNHPMLDSKSESFDYSRKILPSLDQATFCNHASHLLCPLCPTQKKTMLNFKVSGETSIYTRYTSLCTSALQEWNRRKTMMPKQSLPSSRTPGVAKILPPTDTAATQETHRITPSASKLTSRSSSTTNSHVSVHASSFIGDAETHAGLASGYVIQQKDLTPDLSSTTSNASIDRKDSMSPGTPPPRGLTFKIPRNSEPSIQIETRTLVRPQSPETGGSRVPTDEFHRGMHRNSSIDLFPTAHITQDADVNSRNLSIQLPVVDSESPVNSHDLPLQDVRNKILETASALSNTNQLFRKKPAPGLTMTEPSSNIRLDLSEF